MNAHSKGVSAKADRATAAAQSDPQAVPSKAGIPNAMEIWNALGKTDPKHTKGFKRAGGFSGTALKPIWVEQRLTEVFGPCGTGWGMARPEFQVVSGHNHEVLVYCTLSAWYWRDDEKRTVFGVGGDKVVTHIKANEKYNRAERWDNDDEAFKKAFTDALLNAFKHVGVGADIHMGLFDDSKYVAAVAREFAEGTENGEQDIAHPKQARGLEGPYTSKAALFKAFNALQTEVIRCGDDETLTCLLATDDSKAVVEQCERDAPHYLHGGEPAPEDFEPLYARIKRMRDEFQLEKAA